jgi:hypothetical protein
MTIPIIIYIRFIRSYFTYAVVQKFKSNSMVKLETGTRIN